MNEQVEVLQAIYSRSNELVYDHVSERITYNAFDDQRQCVGFSTSVCANDMIIVESHILTKDELHELRAKACSTTTLYDLFTTLKYCYDELMMKRTKQIVQLEEYPSTFLMQIDHMRSPTVYMKHLRQWADELRITGRVLVIPHRIFILIEGGTEHLKKFIVKLKTETVDIDSRGRPCKERLLTQLVELNKQSSKFGSFEKIEFNTRQELVSYLTEFKYKELVQFVTHG